MRRVLLVQRKLTHYRKLLISYLRDQGDFEIVVCATGNPSESDNDTLYFKSIVKKIKMGGKSYEFFWSPDLIKYIKNNYGKYDLFILEGATNLFNNLSITNKLIKAHKPYVIWDAGRRKNAKMTFARKLAQKPLEYVWKNAAAIMAYSTLAKQYFIGIGIDPDKIFVCQNTLNVSAFDKEISSTSASNVAEIRNQYAPNGEKLILYVGAVEKRKRIEDLLNAFKEVKEKNSEVVLLIIGGGEQLKEIKSISNEIDKVFCLGPIIEGVIKYFMAADLFALPSEGGLSINQAMICSKPVIASSADGTELDLIHDGKNGYIFTETNVSELADSINNVLQNNINNTMGQYSRKIIDELVNERNFRQQFITAIDSIKGEEY